MAEAYSHARHDLAARRARTREVAERRLRAGATSVDSVARGAGVSDDLARSVLQELQAEGRVELRRVGSRRWVPVRGKAVAGG